MSSARLEAFSDGVIAILITIMVLEIAQPKDASWDAFTHVVPRLALYLLSFVFLGIYWNNHHHMLMLTERINGKVLWANLHLLFWLSLLPYLTLWMGDSRFKEVPTALYGADLLLAAIAYYILVRTIVNEEGEGSALRAAIGEDFKGKISPAFYAVAVPLAFVDRWISLGLYFTVAAIWLIPDKRIESRIAGRTG